MVVISYCSYRPLYNGDWYLGNATALGDFNVGISTVDRRAKSGWLRLWCCVQGCVDMEELRAILAIRLGRPLCCVSRRFGDVSSGLFITVPLAVCIQVIAYRDIFKPEETFQQEVLEPWQEYPFKLKAKHIGPISQIRELRNQIFEQIHTADDSVKPLLEDSIEHINNVCKKAVHLSGHLQQIDAYLETTNIQTLHTVKNRDHEKAGKVTQRCGIRPI